MISVVVSIVFGVLAFFVNVPIILPIFGMLLALNGIMKENKKEAATQDKKIKVLGSIGAVLCLVPVALHFLVRLELIAI